MRLSDEKVKSIKWHIEEVLKPIGGLLNITDATNLLDTIEVLRQENEQLRAQVARMREVVVEKTNALKAIFSKMNYTGHAWMPLDEIDDFLASETQIDYHGRETCGWYQNIQAGNVKVCDSVIYYEAWCKECPYERAACSIPADYHNPADVEALRKTKEFLDRIYPADVFTGESGDEGALMVVELRKVIDKAIGGKEDGI